MTKIIELQAQNFKRLKAITIRPEGSTVVIGGRNAQGKSSTLDAIMAALGGGRALPAEPIRHGEKKASIRVELGDLVVTRKFGKTGSKLEVVGKDGSKLKSPQTILDKLTGSLSFDPLAFTRQTSAEQAETLRKLAGLDLSDVDEKIAALFEARKDQNREAKRLKGAAESLPYHKDVPIDQVVIGDLIAEMSKRRKHNDDRKSVERASQTAAAEALAIESRVAEARTELAKIEEAHAAKLEERDRLEQRFSMGHWENCDEIQAQIESAEETNAKVRENESAFQARKAHKLADELASELNEKLEDARAERAERIEAASFPVDGLTVSEDGVEFNGVAFEQASGAEKIRVSAAIGLAMNPELRVLLIRDGSLLDADAMTALQKVAADNEAQIWLERVGEGDAGGIIIEDGEIKEG